MKKEVEIQHDVKINCINKKVGIIDFSICCKHHQIAKKKHVHSLNILRNVVEKIFLELTDNLTFDVDVIKQGVVLLIRAKAVTFGKNHPNYQVMVDTLEEVRDCYSGRYLDKIDLHIKDYVES